MFACRHTSLININGYGLDDRGSIPGRGSDSFYLLRVQTGPGARRASYPVGIGGSLRGVKEPKRNPYHSSTSGVEIKNAFVLVMQSRTELCR